MLRGALDVAGAAAIEDIVAALIDGRRRTGAIAALGPAVDELAERSGRMVEAVSRRDAVGTSAQNALHTAIGEQDVAGAAVSDLTAGVIQAGDVLLADRGMQR